MSKPKIGQIFKPYKMFKDASILPSFIRRRPRSELSYGGKVTYSSLLKFIGKNTFCWPSEATIGADIGCSVRQVRRYIRELEGLQLIKVVCGRRLGRTSRYAMLWHPWIEEDQRRTSSTARKKTKAADVVGQKRPIEKSQGKEPSQKESTLCSAATNLPEDPRSVATTQETKKPAQANSSHPLSQVLEEAADKTSAALKKRASRQEKKAAKKAQRAANLQGKADPPSTRKQLKACETLFLSLLKAQFPGTFFAPWGPKERGQCRHLLGLYPFDVVKSALKYVVEGWGGMRGRFKVGPVPSLGWLVTLHSSLVPEAQQYDQCLGVKREWDSWAAANPTDFPPADLTARFDAVKPDLEAFGLA